MKNKAMQYRLSSEVLDFIHSRRSLQLATLLEDGSPYASYAPFAIGDECLYVVLSEIAVHGLNLQRDPRASVLIVEDEDTAGELFARIRVNYAVRAEALEYGSDVFRAGVDCLAERLGDRPRNLSELQDFRLFRLVPLGGRYVKGFGKAYNLVGNTLAGEELTHMRDGHRPREAATG
jgi:hypothetical protein